MSTKKLLLPCAAIFLALLLSPVAQAAGVQALITTTLNNNSGVGTESYSLFLNDSPLPNLASQTVTLNVGDVLRAEVNTTATTDDFIGTFSRSVFVDLSLDAGTDAATIQSTLQGTVNATGGSVLAGVFGEVVCDFTSAGCQAPGLPLSTAFLSAISSWTLTGQVNERTLDNVTTPTGNIGGEETLNHDVVVDVQRALGDPIARTSVSATSQAISEAIAVSADGTLLVTVTSTTVVPVPGAVWLFGSALGLLGWMRRRQAPSRT